MRKLELTLILSFLLQTSRFATLWFAYWAFFHEMGFQGRTWRMALRISWPNWLLFFASFIAMAVLEAYIRNLESMKSNKNPEKEEPKEDKKTIKLLI